MKILLAGGGTGGPVVPLIAVQQKIKAQHPEAEFLFVDAPGSPGEDFARQYGIPFQAVSAGKLRRYFSFQNLLAPFQVVRGYFQAVGIMRRFNPDVAFACGGFVSVPVLLAAYTGRRRIAVHQQDVEPSLSNKLLAPLADRITVSFEASKKDFYVQPGLNRYVDKVSWTGNPVRTEILQAHSPEQIAEIKRGFGLDPELPTLLVFGGATGAQGINDLVRDALPELIKFMQVLHASGKRKAISFGHPRYRQFDLISNMGEALACADVVICRAGLSTISELAALRKVAIVIPMPDSHQRANALVLDQQRAAIVLDQRMLTPEMLIASVRQVLYDADWQRQLRENIGAVMPGQAAEKIAAIIIDLCKQKTS